MKSTASALAFTLTFSCGLVIGCTKPAASPGEKRVGTGSDSSVEPAATPSSSAESAKTRELEEKAAGYEERFKEIQESEMSAEQKAQAAGELVDEQQRTVREAQDGPAGEESAPPQ